jgi:hypothetical protein
MKTSFVVLLIATAGAVAAGPDAAAVPIRDLTGRILTQAGSPLSSATVFFYIAGPKVAPDLMAQIAVRRQILEFPNCHARRHAPPQGSSRASRPLQ